MRLRNALLIAVPAIVLTTVSAAAQTYGDHPHGCPRIDLRMGRAANRSASKARIAGFRGAPYSPFLENFGFSTFVQMSAYGY